VGTSSVKAANGTAQLPLNTWSHLASTYDGATLRLFVNGTEVGSLASTGNIATSTGDLWIGANNVWPEWFSGLIDEVRVYNRALSAAEINTDMNRSVGIPDTEAPTAPTNLVKTGSTAASISISWSASTDNVGVAGYRIFRGTTEVGTTAGTMFTIPSLACGTAHDLSVEAYDFSTNVSPRAQLTASTSDCDVTPPTVSVTDPAGGATVSGTTVNVAASASDNDAVAGVQFLVDGAPLGAEDTSAPYSVTWNSWNQANGDHTLTARARDASGNTTTSAGVNVTVENTGLPPAPGLVASYGFDEGAGTAAADSTGNSNHGTVNGPAWTIGRFGQALSFDGTNDRVSVPDSATLDLTTGMTLEAWVKPTALGTAWKTVLFKHRNSNATNMVYVLYGNRNTSVPNTEVTVGTSVRAANGSSQLPLNVWSHLASTYDGATLRLFVNGTQVGSLASTGNIATSTGDLWIGGNNVWSEWFSGAIDEVRVYNRALTAAEIQADMNRAAAPDNDPPGIASTTPADAATNVPVSSTVTATFDEAMNPASITGTTFELRDATNALVTAAVTYDSLTGRATLTPSAPLAFDSSYTATVKGGASGVKDFAGNPLAADRVWTFLTAPPPPPVAVFSSTANKFGAYAVELLKAEGLNSVDNVDVATLGAATLAGRDVVVLGETALTAAQVTALTTWVNGGGNLIALRPDKQLAALLGITDQASTLTNAYMRIDTTPGGPGAGLTSVAMQYHGTADRYALGGAIAVATLYSSSSTATANPAVTLRSVGSNGGQAAAFTYDLSRSVVYTRQGNPAWEGQNRDGIPPTRTNDLFYGAMTGDVQPDWIDTLKIAIPQADEQQRLLANLVLSMSRDKMPLPRFWYFPRDEKAVVVMTGDDHAEGGTAGRFDQYKAFSPPGCSVADWECVRSTSYVYPDSPLTNAQAGGYHADGFEVALHVSTGCSNNSPTQLNGDYRDQLAAFAAKYTGVPAPQTNRTHCVAWSDWATQPKTELAWGIRFDTNYYHYPAGWIGSLPGFMTGSGLVMRFADLDGTTIDTWQAHTHMNDEAAQPYPATSNALLDGALGANGYYGYFTVNMHTDFNPWPDSDAIVNSALTRGVPVVSAKQAFDFIDGRDRSTFTSFTWSSGTLGFTLRPGTGARGLRAMLPRSTTGGTLNALTKDGVPVTFTTQTIKGFEYAVFDAQDGRYAATYGP
jgi:chitodextrinase